MEYQVIRIAEDMDYGCEEREESSPVCAIVFLKGEDGRKRTVRHPDALLYERKINKGSEVIFLQDGTLFPVS